LCCLFHGSLLLSSPGCFVTPSVLCTPGPGRREDSRWIFTLDWSVLATLFDATRSLLVLGVRAGALTGSRHAGAALRSFMTSNDTLCSEAATAQALGTESVLVVFGGRSVLAIAW
jgi:hypothetical protein